MFSPVFRAIVLFAAISTVFAAPAAQTTTVTVCAICPATDLAEHAPYNEGHSVNEGLRWCAYNDSIINGPLTRCNYDNNGNLVHVDQPADYEEFCPATTTVAAPADCQVVEA